MFSLTLRPELEFAPRQVATKPQRLRLQMFPGQVQWLFKTFMVVQAVQILGHVQTPAAWVFASGIGRLHIGFIKLGGQSWGELQPQVSCYPWTFQFPKLPSASLFGSKHPAISFGQRPEGGALLCLSAWLFPATGQKCGPGSTGASFVASIRLVSVLVLVLLSRRENDKKTFAPGIALILKVW